MTNGTDPIVDEIRHQPWCQATQLVGARCTCYPIPALRCNDCDAVFAPTPVETPEQFGERVRLHAMLHPGANPSFTQGTTAHMRGEPGTK